jgi:hypothetical protein
MWAVVCLINNVTCRMLHDPPAEVKEMIAAAQQHAKSPQR